MKLYARFTLEDAKFTIKQYKDGWKVKDIASFLNFSERTINRNLKKARTFIWKKTNTWAKKVYQWHYKDWLEKEQNIKEKLNKNLQNKLFTQYQEFIDFAHKLVNTILHKQKRLYSVHTIIDLFQSKYSYKCPQKSQFYNWINAQKYGFRRFMFPNFGSSKYKKAKTKQRLPRFNSIETRGAEANLRLVEGHLEIDSFEGRKNDKYVWATMIDRRTRKIGIHPYKNKCPKSFLEATKINLLKFKNVKTITMDNGVENSRLGVLEKKIKLYNTHPYSSWEKGSIENSHRLIRRFKRKGKSLDDFTINDIKQIENYINNYPRLITKNL